MRDANVRSRSKVRLDYLEELISGSMWPGASVFGIILDLKTVSAEEYPFVRGSVPATGYPFVKPRSMSKITGP
jgi:hypothetical protein